MAKTICGNCNIKMHHEESGVLVLELYEDGKTPYKVWSADLYTCGGCKNTTLSGFGFNPISNEFESDFSEHVQKSRYQFKEVVQMDTGTAIIILFFLWLIWPRRR